MAAQQTIHFDSNPVQRIRSRDDRTATSSSLDHDGIVFSRTKSFDRSSHRSRSRARRGSKQHDDDDPEYTGLRREGDYKKKQIFTGSKLFFLAYQSVGVIYGDIGTSPLYVFSSTFVDVPVTRENVIGALSLIIWSLLMMVTLKYVIIILHADNEGEGGTFSCYSLLSRYANITHRDPREEPLIKVERWKTEDLHTSNVQVRNTMEKSKFLKGLLKVVGVLAVSMVMSDGVLTPAQSVLGAVQGLEVIVPDINKSVVVGTTCGILILLFAIQPFGTTKIGSTFAPISMLEKTQTVLNAAVLIVVAVIIWLGTLASFGIYNLVQYDWRVLKAFNPAEGFEYLIRNKKEGWLSLGGILLAFTGVEALFADLGAFSMRAIQMSWLGYCLPCLLLAYIGQAAKIVEVPSAYAYPVFYTVPPGCLIYSEVIAILAAIVASQAIITATFQLLAQIIKLSYFPQIQVVHTSKTYHNQLYVPLVNYLLCIGTVVITAVFNNTTSLGQAYGVCVMFVTFFDTTMTTLVSLLVWRIKPLYVLLPWLTIASMDGAYLSSALTKVPHGAWVTITIALVLTCIFILWRFGKESQWTAEAVDRHSLATFITKDHDGTARLASNSIIATANSSSPVGGETLSITKGLGIFFDKGGIKTPLVFSQFIQKLVSMPQVIVFFHMRPLEIPTVPSTERFVVSRIRYLPNCYRIVVRHGFMDEVVTEDLAALMFRHLCDFVVADHGSAAPTDALPNGEIKVTVAAAEEEMGPEARVTLGLRELQEAYDHRVLYIIGKEQMKVRPHSPIWRVFLLKLFLFMRDYSRTKMANLKVPTDRLVEIGFIKEV